MNLSRPLSRSSGSRDEALDDLVEEIVQRMHRGENVALDDYVSRHPEFGPQLRQMWPTMHLLAALGYDSVSADSAGQENAAAGPPRTSTPPWGQLGDFQILREVGRGGMGVVYEAEQISLKRRVALKVLPFAATMDARQLQRFKNEALAAASLDHPHIVNVYAVGQERGVHYFAMKFIDGRTLAEFVARQKGGPAAGKAGAENPPTDSFRPTAGEAGGDTIQGASATAATMPASVQEAAYFKQVARLGIQAAEALEHAHVLGIVHRDIKPANLLLDAQGEVWVTDFGLARTAADSNLTMTGDVLGTLRYMSPEQALAKHGLVDQRTDIYALGATLYELLTLKPAIDGRNREEILNTLTVSEPVRPRKWNRAIPTDLETIVLKAMRPEAKDRYRSARELAEDLTRFVEHKPIAARRPGWIESLQKLARRNRPVMWALAVGLLLAFAASMIGMVVSMAYSHRAAEAEQLAENRLKAVDKQREKVERNFKRAREAVDKMLLEVGNSFSSEPGKQPLRRKLLEDALEFYEDLLDEDPTDPAVLLSIARTHSRLGNNRTSLEITRKLVADYPGEPAYRNHLVYTLGLNGSYDFSIPWSERTKLHRLAVAVAEGLAADHPKYDKQLHTACFLLGRHIRRFQPEEAELLFRRCLSLPGDYHHEVRAEMGLLAFEAGRLSDAEVELRKAISSTKRMLADHPQDINRSWKKKLLADFCVALSRVYVRSRRDQDAKEYFGHAINFQKELAFDHPGRWANLPNRAGLEFVGFLRSIGECDRAELLLDELKLSSETE